MITGIGTETLTGTAKPQTGGKPRAVIIRLHHFLNKERIIREARARRGKLLFRGKPIFIFEDYAPDVLEQRMEEEVQLCPNLTSLTVTTQSSLSGQPGFLISARLYGQTVVTEPVPDQDLCLLGVSDSEEILCQ
ncbi:hypothetical protein NFI96_032702, partial [Prochilodus magdalenae]